MSNVILWEILAGWAAEGLREDKESDTGVFSLDFIIEQIPSYKAGDENRTHATSLEGWSSTTELRPRFAP